jgi:lipid-A-disaccharide synthase
VPELLQKQAVPEALADAVMYQLNDETNRRSLIECFTQMHHTLRCQAAERAADAIMEMERF